MRSLSKEMPQLRCAVILLHLQYRMYLETTHSCCCRWNDDDNTWASCQLFYGQLSCQVFWLLAKAKTVAISDQINISCHLPLATLSSWSFVLLPFTSFSHSLSFAFSLQLLSWPHSPRRWVLQLASRKVSKLAACRMPHDWWTQSKCNLQNGDPAGKVAPTFSSRLKKQLPCRHQMGHVAAATPPTITSLNWPVEKTDRTPQVPQL